jgi:hypothetical protein
MALVCSQTAEHDEGLVHEAEAQPNSSSTVFAGQSEPVRWQLAGLRQSPTGTASVTRENPQIFDDFPEVVPVAQRELDIIETYLGSMVDDMLKGIQ